MEMGGLMAAAIDIDIDQGATYAETLIVIQPERSIIATAETLAAKNTKLIEVSVTAGTIEPGQWLRVSGSENAYRVIDFTDSVIEVEEYLDESISAGASLEFHKPCNLTGYQARGQIRRTTLDTEPLAIFETEIDPELGALGYMISAEDTATIPTTGKTFDTKNEYQYSQEIQIADLVVRLTNGKAIISPEATK